MPHASFRFVAECQVQAIVEMISRFCKSDFNSKFKSIHVSDRGRYVAEYLNALVSRFCIVLVSVFSCVQKDVFQNYTEFMMCF